MSAGTKLSGVDLSFRAGGVSVWEDTKVLLYTQGRCWRAHKSEGREERPLTLDERSDLPEDQTSTHWWLYQLHPGSTDMQFVGGL